MDSNKVAAVTVRRKESAHHADGPGTDGFTPSPAADTILRRSAAPIGSLERVSRFLFSTACLSLLEQGASAFLRALS